VNDLAIVLLGVAVAGVLALAAVALWPGKGQRQAPRGDRLDPLPRDRFSPGVRLPRTPPLTAGELEDLKQRFTDAMHRPIPLPPPPLVTEVANPVANPVPSANGHDGHDGYQALVAAYDRRMTSLTDQLDRRLDTRPDWLRELAPHPDNARAVDSMAQRALTPDLLALLDEEADRG